MNNANIKNEKNYIFLCTKTIKNRKRKTKKFACGFLSNVGEGLLLIHVCVFARACVYVLVRAYV